MRRALLLLALTLAGPLAAAPVDQPPAPPPACPRCDTPLPAAPAVVLDTKTKAEHRCCGLSCAIRETADHYPTAIITLPVPESNPPAVVKVVRTGAQWTCLPPQAVFLLVDAKDRLAGQQAFPTQALYIRYLAHHPELMPLQPKPLRWEALRQTLLKPAKTG